jgi:hypothetical protein
MSPHERGVAKSQERCSIIYATAVFGYKKISEEGVVHDFKRDQLLSIYNISVLLVGKPEYP